VSVVGDVGCIVGSAVLSLITSVGKSVLDCPIGAGETVGTSFVFLLDILLDLFILLLPTEVPFMPLLDFPLLLLLLFLLFFDPLPLDPLGFSLKPPKTLITSPME